MPIIFPFTEFGTIIATAIFFGSLIYCGLAGVYLDTEKSKRHLGLRISVLFAALLMFYCEYSAVNIGFTLNPPKNVTFKCVEK
jgi:dolichyl-phosphate-mannose--protein O-mannosyl transferase